MIKHLYYLLKSDFKTLSKKDFDADFKSMGLNVGTNTSIIEDVILDYMENELLNAPTLFTSFTDFKQHLHYQVRMNALKLYHLANVYSSLTADYLKSSGGEKRTLNDEETKNANTTDKVTESTSVDSSGTASGSNSNFRKFADTPTKVEASEQFVDKYTTEQESNSNSSSENNSQSVDSSRNNDRIIGREDTRKRNLTEEKFNTTDLSNVLLNIESLRQGLYNEVKKMENKLMYQLLYDIDN